MMFGNYRHCSLMSVMHSEIFVFRRNIKDVNSIVLLNLNCILRSDELKKEYDALTIEKAELERNINRRQEKVKKLLADTRTLYQTCEEQEARDELLGGADDENWDPQTRALELWNSAENIEEMQGIIVALKQKRAAISTECSDVLSKLKDLKKTS